VKMIGKSATNFAWLMPDELENEMDALGQPRFRAKQLFSWLHNRGIGDPEQMTNLPIELRKQLSENGLNWPARIGRVLRSKDGTRKLQVDLADGYSVETVLIPDGDKLTQCISCQVGCAVRCVFCRSGHDGLRRNLSAGEIVSQIHLAKKYLEPGERLKNVVFMGIGEPLHNLEAVVRALQILGHQEGPNLSSRRVTVSTVGTVRGIRKLADVTGGQVALAISLHAADDETRRFLVPKVTDSLKSIIEELKRFPLPKRRRFTIEYVLVDGVNDSTKDAARLVKLLSALRVKVNLLPLNPHDKTHLRPPREEAVLAFQDILVQKGVSAFLRRRRGDDIGAACGQLLGLTTQ